jgi:hypothetical protein
MNGPLLALGGLAAVEGVAALVRLNNRSSEYTLAEKRAHDTGRTFVVVGSPSAGMHTAMVKAYGCGDICIDLDGCLECPVHLEADIIKPLPIVSDSAVVYVACVLEYVNDFDAAWNELERIAGSPDNMFVVPVQPWTFTAAMYPTARQTLWEVPREGGRPSYEASEVSGVRKVASWGLVLGLLGWGVSKIISRG